MCERGLTQVCSWARHLPPRGGAAGLHFPGHDPNVVGREHNGVDCGGQEIHEVRPNSYCDVRDARPFLKNRTHAPSLLTKDESRFKFWLRICQDVWLLRSLPGMGHTGVWTLIQSSPIVTGCLLELCLFSINSNFWVFPPEWYRQCWKILFGSLFRYLKPFLIQLWIIAKILKFEISSEQWPTSQNHFFHS